MLHREDSIRKPTIGLDGGFINYRCHDLRRRLMVQSNLTLVQCVISSAAIFTDSLVGKFRSVSWQRRKEGPKSSSSCHLTPLRTHHVVELFSPVFSLEWGQARHFGSGWEATGSSQTFRVRHSALPRSAMLLCFGCAKCCCSLKDLDLACRLMLTCGCGLCHACCHGVQMGVVSRRSKRSGQNRAVRRP